MAQVPYTPYPTTPAEGVPARSHDYEEIHAEPSMFGALQGQALEKGATALERTGAEIFEFAKARAGMQNELWANDANTSAMKQYTDLYSEYGKLEGQAAVQARPKFISDIENVYKSTIGSAPNLQAQSMLARSLRYMTDSYGRYATNYADQQWRVWQDKSTKDAADEFANQAGLAVNNPDEFHKMIFLGGDQVRKLAEQKGMGKEEQDAEVARYNGRVLTKIIGETAKGGDIARAEALYQGYRPYMDASGRYETESILRPMLAKEKGDSFVDQATSQTPLAPTPIAAPSLAHAIETAGEHGTVGAKSTKGALGPMQVMPGTGKDMATALGQPYDENRLQNDAEYNRQIGSAYLSQLLQKYGGNQTLAVAAYNAGPDRVDGWIKLFGDPRTGAISDADFAARIPFKETKDYVARVNTAFPQGAGGSVVQFPSGAALPMSPRASAYERVDELTRGQDPLVRAAAFEELGKRQKAMDAAYTDQERYHRLHQQQIKDVSEAAEMDYRKEFFGPNPGNVTASQIVHDPRLDRESQDRLLALMSGTGAAAARISHATTVDLFNRMRLPPGDPNRLIDLTPVYKAFGTDKLTKDDFNWVVKSFTEDRTDEGQKLSLKKADFVKAYEQTIDRSSPLTGHTDPQGPTKLYLFQWDIDQKVAAARKAGKDPFDLFDPSKPDFAGKPDAIKPYTTTLDEAVRNIAQKYGFVPPGVSAPPPLTEHPTSVPGSVIGKFVPLPPTPTQPGRPAPNPGETPDAYMKRLGL